MKRITLLMMLVTACFYTYATTWTITSPGFTFSPATLTIQSGDDLDFDIEGINQVQEVSEATWNNNGTTPLAGGFSTPNGGGPVSAAKLTVGTHWYVCVPHASMGMKGKIIVEATTGIEGVQPQPYVSIFPNPTNGKIHLLANGSKLINNYNLTVFDMTGKNVYSTTNADRLELNQIDLSGLAKGIYVVRIFDGINIYNRKLILN
jgi:plastocyanin